MKQKIKQLLCFLLACQLFLIQAYARPDWPSDTGIQAEAGIVVDMDSGAVIMAQNSHVAYPPASITKILTALIVLEHAGLDETVTFSDTCVNRVEADSGNKISIVAGDQLSVEDCLYALLLVSSNQTANALAEHVAGTMENFVTMMNEKLAELGCTESHFDNPSGLNGDTQYVTAYDMAKIARAAYSNEKLVEINSAVSHKIAPTTNNPEGLILRNEHRLIVTEDETSPFYYPPAKAGKTGYLIAAGNTLVTYAEQDGRRLVSVILKGTPRQYFVDCKTLLEFGFSRFTNVTVADYESRYVTGDGPIELDGVTYRSSDLMIDPDSVITLPKNSTFEDADISLGPVPADHPAGAVAQLTYTYNDRVVGTAFLMTREIPEEPSSQAESDSAPADASSEAPDDSQASAPDTPADASPAHSSRSVAGTLALAAVLLAVALIGAAIGWLIHSHRKEAEALALRREQRRKRLQESGEEEEFERLLEEYRQRERHDNTSH
ncbi:MAG: D-alanyl-D-alanine carboxypeptidase [Lachnospiraceae bacterium]|nr:D-alanyl-D-alanine carboxypeptidase [Lachnospiraceae bacterium]